MQTAGAVSYPRTAMALVAEEAAMKKRREMVPELPGVTRMHPRWEGILRGDHPLAGAQRLYRRFFSLFPSPWRCKFCNAPFSGPVAGSLKWIGYSPSRKNASICAR
jgi:hypothetical protein